MNRLVWGLIIWNCFLTLSIVLLDKHYDRVTVKIAEHIVESHTEQQKAFKELYDRVMEHHP